MKPEDYQKLRDAYETSSRKADQAAGALALAMKQLKEEFGCSTPRGAVKLMEELKAREDAAKLAFDQALKRFNEQWPDVVLPF